MASQSRTMPRGFHSTGHSIIYTQNTKVAVLTSFTCLALLSKAGDSLRIILTYISYAHA